MISSESSDLWEIFHPYCIEEHHCYSLLNFGGGYFDAGRHSGALFQVEYKGMPFCGVPFRPQFGLLTAEMKSFLLYGGIGLEIYLNDRFILTPSFSPGLYYKGNGKNLGCPIEFRSAFEVAYEWKSSLRLGVQVFHISNAHLSHRNPGANALLIFLGTPLQFFFND